MANQSLTTSIPISDASSLNSVVYLFKQPNVPEEFGVTLAPDELRSIDFSALDFPTLQRSLVGYLASYFANDFNDYFASNGVIMMTELVAHVGDIMSERGDILVNEAFLPTAQSKESTIQHLALINQTINKATPAITDIAISISAPSTAEIKIPAGTRFSVTGPDNSPVYYEIYRAPGDFISDISIPPGKRGVIAFGIEGLTINPITSTAIGGSNQFIIINQPNVLDEPITVQTLLSTGVIIPWTQVDTIETSLPSDYSYEVQNIGNATKIIFGDNVTGRSPVAGEIISVICRVGGGIRGRIAAGIISATLPITIQNQAAVDVLFTNIVPSSGGTDEETINQAKARAPKEYATHGNAVTAEDYSILASNFSHPVFGSVAKAVAVLRTGVNQDLNLIVSQIRAAPDETTALNILKTNFINRNIIEIYILAVGQGTNGSSSSSVLLTPSAGLIQGVTTYFNEINVLTDEVRVYPGLLKEINLEAIIVLSRNVDFGTVKVAVESAINNFFNYKNFEMGRGLYLSNIYNLIQDIPGVKFVNIISPADDLIETNNAGGTNVNGVGFNELITLQSVSLQFYSEPGNFKVPSQLR